MKASVLRNLVPKHKGPEPRYRSTNEGVAAWKCHVDPSLAASVGSHAKDKSGLGTEGLAAEVARILKHLSWEWERVLEMGTKDGEKPHSIQDQLDTGATEYAKLHENGGCARPRPERLQGTWTQLTSRCPRVSCEETW